MPRSNYDVSLYADGSMIGKLSLEEGRVTCINSNSLSEQELAFLFIVQEGLRCLSSGKEISLHFNPYEDSEDENMIVRCQWGKTGVLRLLDENYPSLFQHATSVGQALRRHRNFTCPKSVYRRIPRKRSGDTVKGAK